MVTLELAMHIAMNTRNSTIFLSRDCRSSFTDFTSRIRNPTTSAATIRSARITSPLMSHGLSDQGRPFKCSGPALIPNT